ncbi:MAG: hypothetical protein JNJ61_08965 [Anaerolineae bacterium]|nr:hypothetical protein [Anaerolineae bacterium]
MRKAVLLGLFLALCVLAACDSLRSSGGSAPVLVEDVPLQATTLAPTRVLSATPSPIVIPVSTSALISPLEVITLEASITLVTPTLPPSRTPTLTPTQTPFFTPTPRIVPTPFALLPTAVLANPPVQPGACTVAWFFSSPVPPNCPLNPPLLSAGAFLQFQNGVMLWVAQQDAIYVLYNSPTAPRWQVFNDTYVEGMADTDPAYNNPPPANYQPRRGFGLLWRSQPSFQERLGWALTEFETAFTIQVQIAADGSIYISDPLGGVYMLVIGGADWRR